MIWNTCSARSRPSGTSIISCLIRSSTIFVESNRTYSFLKPICQLAILPHLSEVFQYCRQRSQKPEARSQKPEARSQKPEARSQKPEGRLEAEARRQKLEGEARRQKLEGEARRQKLEGRS